MPGDVEIMERMTEFMCQRYDVGERAVKIRQHAALVVSVQICAECTADLSLAGIEIDPCLIKRTLNHICKVIIKAAEDFQQICLCLLNGIFFGVCTHGRKHIVPRNPVFMTQDFALEPQVAAENIQMFVHCRHERIKGFARHAGIIQSLCQRRLKPAQTCVVDNFKFDAVERKCNRIPNFLIAGKFRLVCFLSNRRVSGIRKVAHGRKGQLFAAEIRSHG